VTFFLFGLPLLRALAGAPSPRPVPRKATLRQAVRHATGRLEFLRGRLHDDGTVEALAAQASGAVTSLAAANALLAIPAELAELAAGSSIDVYPLSTR
jgi:molybdopterin molybdotransferase